MVVCNKPGTVKLERTEKYDLTPDDSRLTSNQAEQPLPFVSGRLGATCEFGGSVAEMHVLCYTHICTKINKYL